MLALILRYRTTVGTTPPGILILHDTHEPVLVGATPLSKILYRDYNNGFRLYIYDRKVYARREKVVPPKDLRTFLSVGAVYYANAKMEIEQRIYELDDNKTIEIDGNGYKLEDIIL